MLLNSCRRARVLLDVRRHRDRFNIFQVAEAGSLAPLQELADGMVISDPRVLVANGNGKKINVSLGCFRADIGDERWNLEGSDLTRCKLTNYFACFLPFYFAYLANGSNAARIGFTI
jgi:hypothetical protein